MQATASVLQLTHTPLSSLKFWMPYCHLKSQKVKSHEKQEPQGRTPVEVFLGTWQDFTSLCTSTTGDFTAVRGYIQDGSSYPFARHLQEQSIVDRFSQILKSKEAVTLSRLPSNYATALDLNQGTTMMGTYHTRESIFSTYLQLPTDELTTLFYLTTYFKVNDTHNP